LKDRLTAIAKGQNMKIALLLMKLTL